MTSLISTGDKIVAVGDRIVTSTDGIVWTERASGTSLAAIAHTDERIVGIGGDARYDAQVCISTDGIHWERQAFRCQLYGTPTCIVWTGRQLLATSGSRIIFSSQDGFAWEQQPIEYSVSSLCWNGAVLVAACNGGIFLTSEDGKNWVKRNRSLGISDRTWIKSIAWTGREFVAGGEDGALLTSKNGADWTPCASTTNFNIRSVTWNGTQLVAVGDESTILTSPDAVNWTRRDSGLDSPRYARLFCGVWTSFEFLVCGYREGQEVLLSSIDAITWENRSENIREAPLTRRQTLQKTIFQLPIEKDLDVTKSGRSEAASEIRNFEEMYRALVENKNYAPAGVNIETQSNFSFTTPEFISDDGAVRRVFVSLLHIDRSNWNQHDTYYMAEFSELIVVRIGQDSFRYYLNRRDVRLTT